MSSYNTQSASFEEVDIQGKIHELFSIWGDVSLADPRYGFITSFLRWLRSGNGIEVSLTLQQKKEVYLIHRILHALKDISDFSLLKKHLRCNSGGHDTQLLATYVYHVIIGINKIESAVKQPFDTDFSFQKEGCEYFVQVKDLTINPTKKFWEQVTVTSLIEYNLKKLGIRSDQVSSIEGIVPKSVSNPGFDWQGLLQSRNLSRPIIIPNEDGVTSPLRITLASEGEGSMGGGIYTLHYLPKRVGEVAETVPVHDSTTEKYACLLFVGLGMVDKIAKSSDQIFQLWGGMRLDGVIFMECQRSPSEGYKFDILEQFKAGESYSLDRIRFVVAY